MNTDRKDNKNEESFEYKLREVSDEEIVSILRYRDHFQPPAVKAAIKEALKRKIISSIDDLNLEEFQPKPLNPRSLFPYGTTDAHTFAIFKSLCRIFYGFGLLPIIHGIVQFYNHEIIYGIIAILVGVVIIYIANRLEKTLKPFYSNLLLGLNVPAIGFAFYFISSKGSPTVMDTFAIAIVILVMLYTTFYLNKLSSYFNNNKEE